jgi:hypothetical protein
VRDLRSRLIVGTPPPVELQKYHESAVDSEDNLPCTRNRVAHETKVYRRALFHVASRAYRARRARCAARDMKQGKTASRDPSHKARRCEVGGLTLYRTSSTSAKAVLIWITFMNDVKQVV